MLIFVCLLYDLILGFCYNNLTKETGGHKLASTITLVLQTKQRDRSLFFMLNRGIGACFDFSNFSTFLSLFSNKFDPVLIEPLAQKFKLIHNGFFSEIFSDF